MKYFYETITALNDGTSSVGIWEATSKNAAISAFHQALASASVNTSVVTCHAEAKDEEGNIFCFETFKNESVD